LHTRQLRHHSDKLRIEVAPVLWRCAFALIEVEHEDAALAVPKWEVLICARQSAGARRCIVENDLAKVIWREPVGNTLVLLQTVQDLREIHKSLKGQSRVAILPDLSAWFLYELPINPKVDSLCRDTARVRDERDSKWRRVAVFAAVRRQRAVEEGG